MISLKREHVDKDCNVNLKYNVQKEAIQFKFVEFFLFLRKIIICLVQCVSNEIVQFILLVQTMPNVYIQQRPVIPNNANSRSIYSLHMAGKTFSEGPLRAIRDKLIIKPIDGQEYSGEISIHTILSLLGFLFLNEKKRQTVLLLTCCHNANKQSRKIKGYYPSKNVASIKIQKVAIFGSDDEKNQFDSKQIIQILQPIIIRIKFIFQNILYLFYTI